MIDGQRAVLGVDGRRIQDGAGIAKLEGATADDRGPVVAIHVRQQCRIGTGAGEGDAAIDSSRNSAGSGLSRGGQRRRGSGVGDRATEAGERIDRVNGAERLTLALQIHHGIGAVEVEGGDGRRGSTGDDGDGVGCARIQIQRAAIHRSGAGVVGRGNEVHHAAVSLEEAAGVIDAEVTANVQRASRDDVRIDGGSGGG